MPDLNAMQRYQVAGQLFKNKRYAEALRLLDELVNEVPGNTDIIHARAMCLAGARRVEEALQAADTLANIYGDPRGAKLRELLTAPRPAASGAAAKAKNQVAPAARKTNAKRIPLLLLTLLLAAAAVGGGAYYYFGLMGAPKAAGVSKPPLSPQPKTYTTGLVGDPDGEKISVVNETGGELQLWFGDVGATVPPIAVIDRDGAVTIGTARGTAKFRARATWGALRFVTENTGIDVSGPFKLVFYREASAAGVNQVKWRRE